MLRDFLDANGKWQCIRCGCCCRAVAYLPKAQYLDRGDGTCRHLTNDNLCGIYDERPTFCRTSNIPASDHERALACSRLRAAFGTITDIREGLQC